MDRIDWQINRRLQLQTGPNQGKTIHTLFPEQPANSELWSALYAALDGSHESGHIMRDGCIWQMVAIPMEGGARGTCARQHRAPSDVSTLLTEYRLQGHALRPLAHNINNQLGAICNYAALLPQHGSEPTLEVNAIQQLVLKTAEQLNRMRVLSAPQDGRADAIPLHRWIPTLVTRVQSSHPRPAIQTDSIPPLTINGVREMLSHAMSQLLLNAIEATAPSGQIQLTVSSGELSAQDLEGWEASPGTFVHLHIADTGEGMDRETLDRMLHIYESGRRPGRGLGLPLALSIVRQHGGRVQLWSASGAGTTVLVSLPLGTPRAVHITPPIPSVISPLAAEPSRTSGTIHAAKRTILVADDTVTVLRATARLLTLQGYNVIQASNGTEALKCFHNAPMQIDAALLDDHMPGFSGVQLATQLQAARPELPVVLMSGQELPHDCPWPVLDKPYRPSQLLNLLESLFS